MHSSPRTDAREEAASGRGALRRAARDLILAFRDFLIACLLLGCGALGLWVVPSIRPEWLPDDVASTVIIVGIVSVAVSFVLSLFRSGWVGRVLGVIRAAFGAVGLPGVVTAILYLLGLFLCEQFGIAPPLERWRDLEPETISFFVKYTTLVLLFVVLVIVVAKAIAKIAEDGNRVNSFASFLLKLRPLWPLFFVVTFLAGLIIAHRMGWAPPLSPESIPEFLLFLPIYTISLIALLVLGWASWRIVEIVITIIRWIRRTEAWRRLWDRGLTRDEWEKARVDRLALKEHKRREEEKKKEEKRAHKAALAAENRKRIERETRELGPVTARLLRHAPLVTAAAQFISFVTSYLGIKIYLSLRQENVEWLHVPLHVPGFIDPNRPGLDIRIMSNVVLAGGASAVMAIIIWGLSALAVGRVRNHDHVPFVVYLFTIGFGLVSTYTAFIMWNGEIASREALSSGLRDTEAYLAEITGIDERLLADTRREAATVLAELTERRQEMRGRALRGYLLDLQALLDEMGQAFSAVQKLGYFLAAGMQVYPTNLTCEIEYGCLSGQPGEGEVAKELRKHVDTFRSSVATWEDLKVARAVRTGDARSAANEALRLIGERDLVSAQAEIARLREAIIGISAENPAVILDKLIARLSVPLSKEAPSAGQREALKRLQLEVEKDLQAIRQMSRIWTAHDFLLPPELRLDEVALDIGADMILIGEAIEALDTRIAERDGVADDRQLDIDALFARIQQDATSDRLIAGSSEIADLINRQRDLIEAQLSNYNPRAIAVQFELLQSGDGELRQRFPDFEVDYPRIDNFEVKTLAVLILDYWYLSVVPLMIQLMLDFGYTLSIIIVVSRLRAASRPERADNSDDPVASPPTSWPKAKWE